MKPPHYIQANTNGRLHAAEEPSLSPLNRGYLYGDAIYEVWRTFDGVIFAWDEHWQRLVRSAAALHLHLPYAAADMLAEIKRTVVAYREKAGATGELYIRLQITRGCGAIGLDVALADQTDFVIIVQPCPVTPLEKTRAGMKLALATSLRRTPIDGLNPAWKTEHYLNNILCLREARARGADEVVMLNQAGEITESAVSNIAVVRDGVVLTPPMSVGILGGITRDLVLQRVGAAAGLAIREAVLRPADLPRCTECFLLSTTKDVAPVAAIDDLRFTVGDTTVGMRLKRAFEAEMRAYAAAHPQQRV